MRNSWIAWFWIVLVVVIAVGTLASAPVATLLG
jgi:hypothetical protein